MDQAVSSEIEEKLTSRWSPGKWSLVGVLGLLGVAAIWLGSMCFINPDHEVLMAARKGHVWKLRLLLAVHPGLARTTVAGRRPIIAAVKNDHLAASKALLGAGADPNVRSPAGRTPLLIAILKQDVGMLRMLLQNGADPNVRNEAEKRPALFFAVDTAMEEIVRLLLENGADPQATDHLRRTAMDGTINLRDPDSYPVVRLLVRYKVNGDPWYAGHALDVVTGQGDEQLVPPFLEAYGDLNRRSIPYPEWTLLRVAVEEDNETLVRQLLEAGADPEQCGFEGRPLIDAARSPAVTELLEEHAKNKKDGKESRPENSD
jgi:hypothetical protein